MANDHIREATKKIRLIDVNDALERLRKVEPKLHVVDYLGIKAVGIDAFIRFLESRKTVDAVEVVRCKDCIYYEIGKDYEPYCNHVTHGIPYPKDDDFCSYGEKRGEGNG